jgi:hypothetical protein
VAIHCLTRILGAIGISIQFQLINLLYSVEPHPWGSTFLRLRERLEKNHGRLKMRLETGESPAQLPDFKICLRNPRGLARFVPKRSYKLNFKANKNFVLSFEFKISIQLQGNAAHILIVGLSLHSCGRVLGPGARTEDRPTIHDSRSKARHIHGNSAPLTPDHHRSLVRF